MNNNPEKNSPLNSDQSVDALYTESYDQLVKEILDKGLDDTGSLANDALTSVLRSNELLPGSEEFAHMELERFEAEIAQLRALGFVDVRINYDDLEVILDPETMQFYIDSPTPTYPENPSRLFYFACGELSADMVPPLHIPRSLRNVDILTINNVHVASVPDRVSTFTVDGKRLKDIILPRSLETLYIENTGLTQIPPLPQDLEKFVLRSNKNLTHLPSLPDNVYSLKVEGNGHNYPIDSLPANLKYYYAYDYSSFTFKERRKLKRKVLKKDISVSFKPLVRVY